MHTSHAGVWENDALAPARLRQMLDASITQLTDLDDPHSAWASLFAPDERVAIKVNTIQGSFFWTHSPLALAVAERLQEVGIRSDRIVIFDRLTRELEQAGYPVSTDGPGARCYGTDHNYSSGWSLMDSDIGLSDILLNCDALINMPILKQHSISGISFAMKNHYGTFDSPGRFHEPRITRALAELNALPPIRDRTRVIIGDALMIVKRNWDLAVPGNSILMSLDPVAHDRLGLELYGKMVMPMTSLADTMEYRKAADWLKTAVELDLGTDDLDRIELREVSLG